MKKIIAAVTIATFALALAGCGAKPEIEADSSIPQNDSNYEEDSDYESSNDYSNDIANSDSTDSDSDYEYIYDEESGMSGVVGEDGDALIAGDGFAMHRDESGAATATDGNGNWVADTDGDGEIDSISTDNGETWY